MLPFNALDVFYITLPVDNRDEAVSLSEYLNQHGVCAHIEGTDGVIVALTDPAEAATAVDLKKGWARFWEHSDSGLFGLPLYTKPSCTHDS